MHQCNVVLMPKSKVRVSLVAACVTFHNVDEASQMLTEDRERRGRSAWIRP